MIIICDCGKELTESRPGINGSDFFECECGLTYNVYQSDMQKISG